MLHGLWLSRPHHHRVSICCNSCWPWTCASQGIQPTEEIICSVTLAKEFPWRSHFFLLGTDSNFNQHSYSQPSQMVTPAGCYTWSRCTNVGVVSGENRRIPKHLDSKSLNNVSIILELIVLLFELGRQWECHPRHRSSPSGIRVQAIMLPYQKLRM